MRLLSNIFGFINLLFGGFKMHHFKQISPKGRNKIILIDYSNYLIVFILLFSVECSSSVVSDLDSDLSLFIRTLAASVGQHSNFYFLAEEVRLFSCFHSL